MKPERWQTTNLKDLARMHLADWEAFYLSRQKEKITPRIFTKPGADAVMRPGRGDWGFSPLCLFYFMGFFCSCTLSPHQQSANSHKTSSKRAREPARLPTAARTPSSAFTC